MSDKVGLIAPPGASCKWRAPGVARDLSDLHTRHSSSAAHVIPSRLAAGRPHRVVKLTQRPRLPPR